jgi:hypothetical protein
MPVSPIHGFSFCREKKRLHIAENASSKSSHAQKDLVNERQNLAHVYFCQKCCFANIVLWSKCKISGKCREMMSALLNRLQSREPGVYREEPLSKEILVTKAINDDNFADADLSLNAVAVEKGNVFVHVQISSWPAGQVTLLGRLDGLDAICVTADRTMMLGHDEVDVLPHHKALSYPSSSVMVSRLLPPRSLP